MKNPADLKLSDEEIVNAKSKTTRVAELMPGIEKLMESGVSRQAILNKLNEQGFDLTMKTFASILQRLRKRNAKTPPPTGRVGGEAEERSVDSGIHSQLVHEQFKNNSDRPRKVQHDLKNLPKW